VAIYRDTCLQDFKGMLRMVYAFRYAMQAVATLLFCAGGATPPEAAAWEVILLNPLRQWHPLIGVALNKRPLQHALRTAATS